MLVFDNCPTCFQDFTSATDRAPISITCGHVFCQACLDAIEPKLCALCRDPFVLREARRIYPSVALDDAADAARIDDAVVKAIDDCQPETFEHAINMLQGWLAKGSSAHASLQSTVIRMQTYKKTMSRLAKAYGDMCEYEAVVRSMEDRAREVEEERKSVQDLLQEEQKKTAATEEEVRKLLADAERHGEEAAARVHKYRRALDKVRDLESELFYLDKLTQRWKEEARNHETDALRWRARYEQAITELAHSQNWSSRATSVSGETFTTGCVY